MADKQERATSTQSQALIVDQARRGGAARAIGGVFAVLTALVFGLLFLQKVQASAFGFALAQLTAFVAFVFAWWRAKDPTQASLAGAVIVAGMLAQHVMTSAVLTELKGAVHVAYHTALCPLIAAATLRSRGVILVGGAGALALAAQIALNRHWQPGAWEEFISPAFYFAATSMVAILASLAGNRALRAHIQQEERALAAQGAAARAEARYQLVARHVSDLVSLFDASGSYLYASPSYERVLGVKPDALVGRQSPELVHADDLPLIEAAFRRAFAGEPATCVVRLRSAVGEFRWFHVDLFGVEALELEGEARAVAVSARDITKQHALADALEKTRRMEALGNLAGGVAHDFNNLLLVVQSCTELAAEQLPADHSARAELDDVRAAAKRAAALTQQLLTFARRQVLPSTGSSVVARTARELAPILVRICGRNIEFTLDAHASSGAVDATALQLEQLLMNLAVNACDAMSGGGKLRIQVRDRVLAPEEVAELAAGPYVEIEVADTGSGMSPEVRERIFEPFFTTKAKGQGTGLGLATVFGLVSQLGGHVSVRSAPGAGSTFVLLLPASRAHEAAEALPRVGAEPRRALDVLVIDDEAAVRSSVARMLASAGHRVTEAESIENASAAAEAPGARFDAIVTDVVIGAGDGVAMLERMRTAQPEAAVVVMSGFSPSPERVARLTEQGAEFLAKPFAAAALLAALDRARARLEDPRRSPA